MHFSFPVHNPTNNDWLQQHFHFPCINAVVCTFSSLAFLACFLFHYKSPPNYCSPTRRGASEKNNKPMLPFYHPPNNKNNTLVESGFTKINNRRSYSFFALWWKTRLSLGKPRDSTPTLQSGTLVGHGRGCRKDSFQFGFVELLCRFL